LGRAADRGMLLLRAATRSGDLHHGVEELAARARHRLAARGVEPAVVLQLESSVVAVELRRADHAIGPRDVLGLVDHVREREALFRGDALHVVERVLAIVARIVRHDGDRADALGGKFPGIADDAIEYRLDVWAMV